MAIKIGIPAGTGIPTSKSTPTSTGMPTRTGTYLGRGTGITPKGSHVHEDRYASRIGTPNKERYKDKICQE
jgi:hypothetical protein